MIHFTHLPTPIGSLLLAADEAGLCAIRFPNERKYRAVDSDWQLVAQGHSHPVLSEAAHQLAAYFAGQRRHFDLPLTPKGTSFQVQTWMALADIPYGQTISYAMLANRLGRPKAVRAVGAANGRNPLPIVLPCHRVIGSDGSLTGFAGGLETKAFLLKLEGGASVLAESRSLFD